MRSGDERKIADHSKQRPDLTGTQLSERLFLRARAAPRRRSAAAARMLADQALTELNRKIRYFERASCTWPAITI